MWSRIFAFIEDRSHTSHATHRLQHIVGWNESLSSCSRHLQFEGENGRSDVALLDPRGCVQLDKRREFGGRAVELCGDERAAQCMADGLGASLCEVFCQVCYLDEFPWEQGLDHLEIRSVPLSYRMVQALSSAELRG